MPEKVTGSEECASLVPLLDEGWRMKAGREKSMVANGPAQLEGEE